MARRGVPPANAGSKAMTTSGQVLSPPVGTGGSTQLPNVENLANSAMSFGQIPQMTYGMEFGDVGSQGLKAYSGWLREEFLPVLQGRQGAQKYREMMDNSPTIGAIMFAIRATMRKVEWRVNPADDSPEAQEAAEFVESAMDDMAHPWTDLIDDNLSMLGYGFAPHELVYKRRLGRQPGMGQNGKELPKSKYDDSLISWRRIPIRGQDTVLKWFFDENGNVQGMTQQPWTGPLIDIPIEKMLLFRTTSYKGNPEGRPLPLDTKVRTPTGWTTMGAIAVGDQVYDETGAVRRVTGKSEVFRDRPVYEIEFKAGGTIRADACHIWRVSNTNDRTAGRTRDLTTEQIAAEFDRGTGAQSWDAIHAPKLDRYRHRQADSVSCGAAPILQSEEANLPLNPYLLGYWLGDGMTAKAAISVHPKDYHSLKSEVEASGYVINHDGKTTAGISKGFLFALRAAGVLGNKHVPQAYMLAAPHQRLALLQGLMDSDGYSPGEGKDEASTFSNTNRKLIDAVCEIVRSLGSQPRVRILEEAGALGGVIGGHQVIAKQTCYEVRFMLDLQAHRLPRKRHAQMCRKTHRNSGHFIKSMQRVENADTVCIEVDSPSHLFLAGETMVPTHNSVFRNCWRPYWFVKRLEEQEAIRFERLNGFPIVRVPNALLAAAQSGDATAVSALNAFKKMATNVRVDEQMGAVLPSDTWEGANGPSAALMYDLTFAAPQSSGKGSVSANETISRYNDQMLMSSLADFVSMGHTSRGAQNLGETKVDMFYQAIEGFLNGNAAVYNRYALPRLWDLNGLDPEIMPSIDPDMAQRLDMDSLGNFILHLSQAGMPLFPDDDLQTALRDAAGLPDVTDSRATDALVTNLDAQAEALAAKTDPGAQSDLQKIIKASMVRRYVRMNGAKGHSHIGKRRGKRVAK